MPLWADVLLCYFFEKKKGSGTDVYRSISNNEAAIKDRYKNTFTAYMIVIEKGGVVTKILKRFKNCYAFVEKLRKQQPNLMEPCPFPPKTVGETVARKSTGLFTVVLRFAAVR